MKGLPFINTPSFAGWAGTQTTANHFRSSAPSGRGGEGLVRRLSPSTIQTGCPMPTPCSPRTILFANGKKRAQLTSHAQDNADGSVTLSFASRGLSGSVQREYIRHARLPHTNLRHAPPFGHGGYTPVALAGITRDRIPCTSFAIEPNTKSRCWHFIAVPSRDSPWA